MNANSSISNNLSLVGVQGGDLLDDDGDDPKNPADNKSRVYGFETLRKEFEEAVNENGRIEALKTVRFELPDLQRYEHHQRRS